MRKWLSISLAGNLLLIGVVVFLLRDRARQAGSARATDLPASLLSPPAANVSALEDEGRQDESRAFRWSQLEAADYKVYVSNLRTIGCPEQTIRDIIAADVDASVYVPRREKLKSNRSSSTRSGDIVGQQNFEMALEQLNQEEAGVLATILGYPSTNNVVTEEPVRISRSRQEAADKAPPKLPLALYDVDFVAMKLDAKQINRIVNIRQKFISEIGGLGADPNDPNYREKWRQAQAKADDLLKAGLGIRDYQLYDLWTRVVVRNQ